MKSRMKIALVAGLVGGLSLVAAAGVSYADKWRGMHEGYRAMHGEGHAFGHGGFGPGGREHGPGRAAMRAFFEFDGNEDGKLSQAEIDESRTARLTGFDQDGDGALTLQEYEALWLDAMRERMVDRFQDLDADGDAKVTLEEFKAPFARMVTMMDRNGDGVISHDDRPQRGEFRHRKDDDRRKGDND